MVGEKIEVLPDGRLIVPDVPMIPYIEGDGVGPDIWKASVRVFDAAVQKCFAGKKKIAWVELLAGEKGQLDLYACIRPVKYIAGVPSPVKHPEKVNMVVFRENTEDVYAGIEWREGSMEAEKVRSFLETECGRKIREDSAIGVKIISRFGTQRLVRRAVQYALAHGRKSVTLVHKGNIMKFTEGAFRDWGYELAKTEFGPQIVCESDLANAKTPDDSAGRLIMKDRIADAMFQQVLLRPEEYEILAMPNLNGDYLSDALAAQVGGLGLAPGANIGDRAACFEATHGSAPKYAGMDVVNPGSVILSGAMMFDFLGWKEVSTAIVAALEKTIADKVVTYDLARQMEGAQKVKGSEFASAVIENLSTKGEIDP
jgi:isocitrate dehydrogenase